MEFAQLGKHCNQELCNQKDFLPFTCTLCKKIFCLDHRSSTDHNCQKETAKKAQECEICGKTIFYVQGVDNLNEKIKHHKCKQSDILAKQQESQKPQFCQNGKKCKQIIFDINCYVCKRCDRQLCLKHRLQEDHICERQNYKLENQVKQMENRFLKMGLEQEKQHQIEQNLIKSNQFKENQEKLNQLQKKDEDKECYICKRKFQNFKDLMDHSQTHYGLSLIDKKYTPQINEQREFCQFCGLEFYDIMSLINHCEQRHNSVQQQIKCN